MAAPEWLLVGLGNPGRNYAGNRHNIGFRALDAVVQRHRFAPFRRRFDGEAADGALAGVAVLALKPMTFMNESGRCVAAAARFYRLAPERIIVFHDELDLAAGKLRVKRGGGAAGHNGLRSLDQHLGPDYWRVRLGIGHPGDKARVLGHVLNDFAAADAAWLEPLLAAVADHAPLLVRGDGAGFMSAVALALQPPKERRTPDRTGGSGGAGSGDAGSGDAGSGGAGSSDGGERAGDD
jgi:PTH1 family peptidyl-tRNA hydrolase